MTPDDPLVGKTCGPYTVVRRIAQGGQSEVYEARADGERVALKVLHPSHARTPEYAERLRREAIAIERLHHPNVVKLLDSGETPDGSHWLAMEYLEGESLAALLEREGTLSEAEVISILAPLCEALQEAHKKGIVHRDLKPQNIMLALEEGVRTPKLLDFGIAWLRDADTLTNSITVRGTPMYMAPEQWDGLKHADARSDVYSLGAIVYQALSGRYAFSADSPLAWMKKSQFATPMDLSEAMGHRPVSPTVCSAVMKALARDPDLRPQTPMELLRALQPAPPSAASDTASRRWLWPLIAVGFAGLVGAPIGFWAGRTSHLEGLMRTDPPRVVLMDTTVAHGVYDAEVVARGGTNADTLNDQLRDLPIVIDKESIPSTWNREMHILEMKPDAIVIHRSAFFHPLNVEFGYGYEPFSDEVASARWQLLYRTAEDKLVAFMGFIGTINRHTRFLVYSRGTGFYAEGERGWPNADYRNQWVVGIEQRFPALKGRISTMVIEGGVEKGSFKDPKVVGQMRHALSSLLGLPQH
jgi:tRNA A-37 threonylcarbamoyl transferase component Bud32